MDRPDINPFEDVYDFWGHRIVLQSNSEAVCRHFRSVYGRFHRGNEQRSGENSKNGLTTTIQITDSISSSGEMFLSDGEEFFNLHCKNLYEFDQTYYGKGSIADPLEFITYLFLKNKYRLIQKYQLFHAAAVSRNGKAVIFPALAGMGKTTLAVKMVQRGFQFLSDEVACVDPVQGAVEPCPRRLNINASSCALLNLPEWPDHNLRRFGTDEIEWAIDIEQIVPDCLSSACSLTAIIFLRGFGEKARLEPLSAANALFKLFKYSFNPPKNSASLLFEYAPLVDKVECFNLVCGDLDDTAEVIERSLTANWSN